MKRLSRFLVFAVIGLAASAVYGQGQNDVKGQEQLKGSLGQFGTTYTLKNKLNLTILGAHYTVEPVEAYEETMAATDGKVFVLDLAVKNADSNDQYLNTDGWLTFVDDKGQQYTGGQLTLESKGSAGVDATLKPGQGLGQAALNDPLRYAIKVPAKARITKVIVNQGRLNTSEDVIRFLLLAPSTDPAVKTFATPLPTPVRDPSDSFGAIALDEGKASIGQAYPSGGFAVKVVEVSSPSGVTFGSNAADEGKKFVVLTLSAKWLMEKDGNVFDIGSGADDLDVLTDTDGETYKMIGVKKLKADEDVDHTFKKNEEYSIRIFFTVPLAAKIKHLTYAAANGRKWGIDLP